MGLFECWKQLSWIYYQYLLVTALYMLEPWERTIFTSGADGETRQTQNAFQRSDGSRIGVEEPFNDVINPNSLLVSVGAMAVYTCYVFMPQHIMAILHYFEMIQ